MPGSVYTIDDSQTLPVHARQRQFAKDQRAAYKGLRSDLSGFGKVAAGAFGKIGPESGSAAAGVTKLDAALDPLLKELRLIREATAATGKGLGGLGGAAKPAAEKLEFLARRLEVVNRLARESSVSTKTARAVVGAYGKELDRVGKDAADYAVRIDKAGNETLSLVAAQRRAVKEAAAMAAAERKAASAVADAAGELALLAKRQEVTARLMRENGVSAKAAGAAARVYGKDIGKLGAEAAQLAKRLDTAQKETDQLRDAQRRASSTVSKGAGLVGKMTTRLVGMAVAYVGVREVLRLVTSVARGSVDAFADLQDAVVSLRKVTDGLGDQGLATLVSSLEALSTGTIPVATESLIELAAVAGQLGIETEAGLANAAATGAKLEAATDLAADAAIKGLARILAIQGEGVGAIDNLGSSLVELGNTSRATEAEIAPIANEIARSTANFDIATPTILGFSAALAEMGAKAEGSGSAMAELFGALLFARETGEGLDGLAKVAGVTADELRRLAEKDITEAALVFLQGLGTFGDRGAIALEEVGLASKRTAKALLPMAANADRVADRVRVSNEAFKDNIALDKEAAAAFSTLRSDVQRTENAFRLLLAKGIAPLSGPMSSVLTDTSELLKAWTALAVGLEKVPGIAAVVAVGMELLSNQLTKPIRQLTALPALLSALAGVGLGTLIADLESVAGALPFGTGAPLLALASDLKQVQDGFLDLSVGLSGAAESGMDVEETLDDLVPRLSAAEEAAKKAARAAVAVSTALDGLRAQVVQQESVALAMDSLGVSAQSAAQIVGTLAEIQKAAGVEGLAAAEAVNAMLTQADNASVTAVAELTTELERSKELLEEIAELQESITRARENPGFTPGRGPGGVFTPGSQEGPLEGIGEFTTFAENVKFAERAAAEAAADVADEFDDLQAAAFILQDAFGGLEGVVGSLANALPQILDGLRSIKSAAGGKKDFAAGVANAVSGSLGFVGQREPGEFGEKRSGDFSDVGEIVGAVVGTFIPVIGTALGAAIGKILGGLIKSGADELLVQFSQVGDDFTSTITKAQGPLGGLGDDISDFLGEVFSNLEAVVGGEIGIQASEIVGGQGISGEGVAAALKFRDGIFIAFVNGMREEFDEASDAVGFITLELLKNAEFGAAISDNVKAALTSDAESLEQLEERITFALGIDKIIAALGPVASAIEEINALHAAETRQARELGLEESQLLQIKDKRLAALRAEVEGELRSVLGITDHAAILEDLSRASAEFNAGIEEERQSRLAEIEVLKEQQAASIAANEAVGLAVEGTGLLADGMDEFSVGMLDGIEGMSGFVAGGRDFTAGLESSADAIERTEAEIQALEESLAGIPDAIDTELLEQAFNKVALGAVDELQQAFGQVEGFSLDSQAAEALRHLVFMENIAQQIAGLELMLLTSTTLTDVARQALEDAVSEGNRLLGGLASGEVTIGQAAGGAAGGGRKQARDDVLDFFADLGEQAAGTSAGMIALTDSLAEFRDAQREAARLGKVGAEVIEQAFRDFLTVSAEAAVEGVRGFLDAASGAGAFELALRDQTAQFADARDQLTLLIQLAEQQGESTAALIDQRRELVEAEQLAAQQLVATNLVDELAALGVGLDPEVLEKMAEAEFRLAQARAISSLAAAAELGLLEGVDVAGLIMDITEATRPDILEAEAQAAREMTDALDEATRATERITGIFDGLRQEAGPAGEGLLSLRGRLQDFRADIREAVELGTFSAGEISGAWQDFLSVSAEVATRGVQGFLDAANGVGLFEAALRDQTAQFDAARAQLNLLIRVGRQEGENVDDLIAQRQDLSRAEELAAKQLAGTALVSELDALGVALDPDVLREMREGELALMKVRAISSVAAAAEAGLLTGGIDEIISQINAVTLDDLSGVDQAGRFETLEDLFGSFADGLEVSILSIGERFDALTENATGLNASQEQLLDLRRRETAELSALADESLRTVQAETAAADGLGPFSDQMLDLSSRFDTVRGELALVIAAVRDAGGSTAELDAQMSSLDRSERVAARGIAVGLVGSLAQLGIALPVDITQRLAQAQFLLAQAEILAALATEEFRMALAQVGVDAGQIIQLVLAGPTAEGATGTPGSTRGGSSGGGGTAPGEDLAALAAQVRETLEGFNRSDLGATASAAADLAQRFKDVREDASRAGVPIEEVAAAIGKARDAFISSSLDAIGPPPDFSATVSELDVLEETFVDVFAALLIAGAGVDDMADAAERLKFNAGQLEAALDAPLDAIIQRLRRDAPDSTNRAVFLESQEAFGDLVATALDQTATEAERVAAVEALADASGDFEQQIMDFLGAGPGAQAALDEMLRALEAVKDEDIIVLTQLDVLKAQAAALAEIELANKAMPTQTQQSSSFSTLGSSVDAIPGALESLIDPILLEELIAAFDAADLDLGVAALSELITLVGAVPFAELTTALADAGVNVADTIAGLTAELGVGGFADLVAELGAVPFASVIASLDAAGVDIVALATELGADQFSALATALTIFDPALIADFGIDALADLTTAVSNSTLDFSTLSFSEIVDELGPLGGIATAIGEEDFRQITEALSPVARDLVTTAAETTATATEAANTAVAVTLDTGAIPNKLTSVRNALGAGGADLNRHTLDTFGAIGTGKGGGSLQGIMSDIAGALGVAGFAEGGIVPFDMLAQVHKNELVVPAERVESLLAGSLGTTFELPAFAPPLPDLPAFGGGFDSGSRDRELLASLASLERAVRRLEKKNDTLTAEARQNAAVIARQVADGNTIARGTRAASAETAENTRRKSKGSGGGE